MTRMTIGRRSRTDGSFRRRFKHARPRHRREAVTMSPAATSPLQVGDGISAWHAIAADEVIQRLNTNAARGLDPAEAAQRLATFGPNRLPAGTKRGPLVRFLLQFNNILVYVLLAAGFVKLMTGLWLDAAIILGVVVINALLG